MQKNSTVGFTLLELVIAIALLGLIMTVAYSSLLQTARTKKILDDMRDGSEIANAVLTRMTREIQLTYSQPGSFLIPPQNQTNNPSSASPSAVFLGEKKELPNGKRGDSITFLAQEGGQYLPDGGTHSGIVQLSYHAEIDKDAATEANTFLLVREEIPYVQPAKKAYKTQMSFPVTSKLTTLEFSYYDGEALKWTETWGQASTGKQNKPPKMVRFTVGILAPDGKEELFTTAVPIHSP